MFYYDKDQGTLGRPGGEIKGPKSFFKIKSEFKFLQTHVCVCELSQDIPEIVVRLFSSVEMGRRI